MKDNGFWKGVAITLILIELIAGIGYFLYQDNKFNTENWKKQPYQFECFMPLEDGNYFIEERGVLHTPSGRLIQCEVLK